MLNNGRVWPKRTHGYAGRADNLELIINSFAWASHCQSLNSSWNNESNCPLVNFIDSLLLQIIRVKKYSQKNSQTIMRGIYSIICIEDSLSASSSSSSSSYSWQWPPGNIWWVGGCWWCCDRWMHVFNSGTRRLCTFSRQTRRGSATKKGDLTSSDLHAHLTVCMVTLLVQVCSGQ